MSDHTEMVIAPEATLEAGYFQYHTAMGPVEAEYAISTQGQGVPTAVSPSEPGSDAARNAIAMFRLTRTSQSRNHIAIT